MKNKILFAILFITATTGISQISYQKRVEFEVKNDYTDEKIIEFGKLGFVMASKSSDTKHGEYEWKYDLYNSDLEQSKTKTISLAKKLYADETFTSKERIHTLYKDRQGNFSLVSVSIPTMEVTQVDGVLPKKSWVKDMAILGDFAFFKTSVKGSSFLYSINWKNGQKKLIPIIIDNIKSKNIFLNEFQIIEASNEIFLYTKVQISKKKSDIYIMRLNDQGEKVGIFNLTQNIEENIVDISASKTQGNKYVFTGTYSTNSSFSSEGLFFCEMENDKVNFIKFYNFLKFKNFLSYLPESRQEKIEKKMEKMEKKGKEFKLNYRIAAHDIIALDDGYLFLGEAYYPTYRTETYTTTSVVNGVTTTTTHTRQVFDGYQYTHAVLSKFGKDGSLVWDETFEMWASYKPYYVKRFISIAEKNQNSIKLVFSSGSYIVAKSFDFKGTVIKDYKSEEIKTNYTGDKAKFSFSNIDFWYDKYFIAYGQQRIKNTSDDDVKRKRNVYFVSKIEYK